MIKRILAGAAAAGFAATLLASGSAIAAPCTSAAAPTHSPAPGTVQVLPGTGSTVYADGGAGGGYIGIKGNNGWLEAGGSPTSGGYVSGHSTPEAIEGKLVIGASPSVCVNGTKKP